MNNIFFGLFFFSISQTIFSLDIKKKTKKCSLLADLDEDLCCGNDGGGRGDGILRVVSEGGGDEV